jgi:hypothetical protein
MKKIPLWMALLGMVGTVAAGDWETELKQQLPLLGHRNWIVVADAAYPLQTAPGIVTFHAGADHLAVVQTVLDSLASARHVRPVILTDTELPSVAEADAPGIGAYRDGLAKLLSGRSAKALPHEEIIGQLDDAGKTFRILLIKTPLTLPYTSVFIRLECGYWSAEAESRLREALKTEQP